MSIENIFEIDSPLDCGTLRILAIIHLAIFLLSITTNSFLLWSYCYHRNRNKSINQFVVIMTILNLFGSLLELPFVVMSQLHCRWVFKPISCTMTGFVMYFVGCSNMYLLAAVSVEQFYTIKNSLINGRITNRIMFKISLACICLSFFWSILPVLGFSKFTLEKSLTTCSVVWNDPTLSVLVYNIVILVAVYVIPLCIILACNACVLVMFRKIGNLLKQPKNKFMRRRHTIMVRRASISMVAITLCFIFSWTPYAIIAIYVVMVDSNGFSPLIESLASIFAKTSMLWTPLIYILSSNRLKKQISSELNQVFKPNNDMKLLPPRKIIIIPASNEVFI